MKRAPEALELFAQRLAAADRVALEATGNALAIARIIEPYVDRVVLADPKAVKGAMQTAKTDTIDSRTLAQLLAGGFPPKVWIVDEETRVLRVASLDARSWSSSAPARRTRCTRS